MTKIVHTKLKGLKELEINIKRLVKQVGGTEGALKRLIARAGNR